MNNRLAFLLFFVKFLLLEETTFLYRRLRDGCIIIIPGNIILHRSL